MPPARLADPERGKAGERKTLDDLTTGAETLAQQIDELDAVLEDFELQLGTAGVCVPLRLEGRG